MAKIKTQFIGSICIVSGVSCILSLLGLTTNNWLDATAVFTERLQSRVNYGLFSGTLLRQQLAATLQFNLAIVCNFKEGVCMYSCQREQLQRERELNKILNGTFGLEPCEQAISKRLYSENKNNNIYQNNVTFSVSKRNTDMRSHFIPVGFWISTLIFTVLTNVFTLSSFVFALINFYTNPIEQIYNIFGLYIWNGSAIVFSLLTLSTWSALFNVYLKNNISITDTMRLELTFSSENHANLNYSFYILLAVFSLNVINIILLNVSRYLMQKACHISTINLEQTDAPLQFY
ncbi:uncharacterized protein LOC119685653 [Teleopsis dalmanni]|uniref:uncharacterized protein LOC119685653 n=1 Tax=Teleopsis dalmanni TaxID=139649 RepID=UPI0018CFE6EA|nr:uncharacterized protein LOC119685653 [Teleopsis dalmanni]